MGFQMQFGAGAQQGQGWQGDTHGSGQVLLYGPTGIPLVLADKANMGVTPGLTAGVPLIGVDYKTPVLVRSHPDGSLVTSDANLQLYDRTEGTAVNTNTWIQTTTTMTITQSAGAILFNAGSSVATTVGAMQTSHRFLPFPNRGALIFRQRGADTAHFANNLIERGFASPASATNASLVNGAVWRKDGTGQYIPVLSINGSEQLGTGISNATFVTSVPAGMYAIFEVVLTNNHAYYTIYTSTGAVLNTQTLEIPAGNTTFTQTHLQAMVRTYNSAATSTAVQTSQDDVAVWTSDYVPNKPWSHQMAGMGFGALSSPTAYTQLANYANSAAPVSAALSNTAAGYTTLGGQYQFAAVAGAETDYALFAIQIPSPYGFYLTDIGISAMNTGAAVGASPTLLQWAIALNSSAVSLATGAPYAPMRVALGMQNFAAAAAIGAQANDIRQSFSTPYFCFPGRFLHVIMKTPAPSLATASQVIRGTVNIGGYFE